MQAIEIRERYRNLLAQTEARAPEHEALEDIVNALNERETAQEAIDIARKKAQECLDQIGEDCDFPEAAMEYDGAAMSLVYEEFLEYTKPQ